MARFTYQGRDLFRPMPAGATDVLASGCFPMVPYVNRIGHGRFDFDGKTQTIAPNMGLHPHPLHGEGWRTPWAVERASETEVMLGFQGPAEDWPWRYQARQRFRLKPDELGLRLSVTNTDDRAMPASIGLHPFFPHARDARLRFTAAGVLETENDLPVRLVEPPPEKWRFAHPRPPQGLGLDHCFTGWSGEAEIVWADWRLQISAPACAFLQVYAPDGEDFFCLEPQTAGPDGLNRLTPMSALGVLAPGATRTFEVRFRPLAAPP